MTSTHIHIFLSPYYLLFFPSFLPTFSITHTQERGNYYLLLIGKARGQEKTYVRVSVWWKTKSEIWGIYTSHIHWVTWGTGTPNDKDEVNKREVSECDVWVCDLEVTGNTSWKRSETLKWFRWGVSVTVWGENCKTTIRISEKVVTSGT